MNDPTRCSPSLRPAALIVMCCVCSLWLQTACQGEMGVDSPLEDTPSGAGNTFSPSPPPGANATDDPLVIDPPPSTQKPVVPGACQEASAPMPMRILSEAEFNHSVSILLGLELPAQELPRDDRVGPFVLNMTNDMTVAHLEDFELAAQKIAKLAGAKAAAVMGCDQAPEGAVRFEGASSGKTASFERFSLDSASATSSLTIHATGNDVSPEVLNADGRAERGWTSIFELRLWSQGKPVKITSIAASDSHPGTEPESMIDGDQESRWAAHGPVDITLKFEKTVPDALEVLWFRGDVRRAFFRVITPQADTPAFASCDERFVDTLASRAFRRPLTPQERAKLLEIYTLGKQEAGASRGVEYVVETVLQAPSFLYVHDLPAKADRPREATEIAHRMAELFWRGLPDPELLAAASSGALEDPREREAQARRMMGTAEGVRALEGLVKQLFGIAHLTTSDLLPRQGEELDEAHMTRLLESMNAESSRFIHQVMGPGDGSYKTLLTARTTEVDPLLLDHYLPPASAQRKGLEGRTQITWPERAGLLGHASFLTAHHGFIHRGLFVREALLCDSVPGPEDIDTSQVELLSTESPRQQSEKLRAHPVCSGCHGQIDPLGLVMEPFDTLGRFRLEDDHKNPLSPTGAISLSKDVDGPVEGLDQLVDRLATSSDVAHCMSKHVLTYGLHRLPTTADACAMAKLEEALLASDGDLREALVALIRTDTFLTLGATP